MFRYRKIFDDVLQFNGHKNVIQPAGRITIVAADNIILTLCNTKIGNSLLQVSDNLIIFATA